VIKELVREYQMASISYLVFGVLLSAIATIGLIFMLKGFADKKEWAYESYSVTSMFITLVTISGALVLAGILIVICKIGPTFAPAWYMIESLTS
jgi:hypothetical protein